MDSGGATLINYRSREKKTSSRAVASVLWLKILIVRVYNGGRAFLSGSTGAVAIWPDEKSADDGVGNVNSFGTRLCLPPERQPNLQQLYASPLNRFLGAQVSFHH